MNPYEQPSTPEWLAAMSCIDAMTDARRRYDPWGVSFWGRLANDLMADHSAAKKRQQ